MAHSQNNPVNWGEVGSGFTIFGSGLLNTALGLGVIGAGIAVMPEDLPHGIEGLSLGGSMVLIVGFPQIWYGGKLFFQGLQGDSPVPAKSNPFDQPLLGFPLK